MNKFLGIVVLSVLFLSCSSNLDFNQVNDFKSEPIAVANLATFDLQANQFVIGGIEQPVVGDVVNFKVFDNVDFAHNTQKVDLYFEFNNTIGRAYVINLYLLDANNVKLYTIPFNIPAYSGSSNLITKTEIFENANLDILKKSQKIAFVVSMLPGIPITDSSLGSLKMRSSATIYLLVQ